MSFLLILWMFMPSQICNKELPLNFYFNTPIAKDCEKGIGLWLFDCYSIEDMNLLIEQLTKSGKAFQVISFNSGTAIAIFRGIPPYFAAYASVSCFIHFWVGQITLPGGQVFYHNAPSNLIPPTRDYQFVEAA
jgi:hypothetical protein